MAGGGVGIALAALLGTLSAHWWWVHLIVLVIVCLVAGGSASLGRRGLVIGTQSLIGFIVFGRFPQSLTAALVLTGYVLAGAALQVGLAASVAMPLAWRRQRMALAAAYRSLVALAGGLKPGALPSATALDAAEQLIAAPALFADQDRDTLADLVGLGRRLRLELAAFAALAATLARTDPELATACEQPIDVALEHVRTLLSSTVAAIEGDAGHAQAAAGGGRGAGRVGHDPRAVAVGGARPAACGPDRPGDGGGPLGRRPAGPGLKRQPAARRPAEPWHPPDPSPDRA